MIEYDEDKFIPVAQSCKSFRSGNSMNGRFENRSESISCNVCKNWNGSACTKNSFNNMLSEIELD